MRDMKEINRIFDMIASPDEEMRNLGMIIYNGDFPNPHTDINTVMRNLAYEAYILGKQHEVDLLEELVKTKINI